MRAKIKKTKGLAIFAAVLVALLGAGYVLHIRHVKELKATWRGRLKTGLTCSQVERILPIAQVKGGPGCLHRRSGSYVLVDGTRVLYAYGNTGRGFNLFGRRIEFDPWRLELFKIEEATSSSRNTSP